MIYFLIDLLQVGSNLTSIYIYGGEKQIFLLFILYYRRKFFNIC
jgi:hypothetical protein